MSTLFGKFEEVRNATSSASASSSTSETQEVIVRSMSGVIQGAYGPFRNVEISGGLKFAIDERRISGTEFFRTNCTATLTLSAYSKNGVEKIVPSNLSISAPDGAFVTRK